MKGLFPEGVKAENPERFGIISHRGSPTVLELLKGLLRQDAVLFSICNYLVNGSLADPAAGRLWVVVTAEVQVG